MTRRDSVGRWTVRRATGRAVAVLAAGALVLGVADAAPAQPRTVAAQAAAAAGAHGLPAAPVAALAMVPVPGDCMVAPEHGRGATDTMVVAFRSGVWYVRGSLTSGAADVCFRFGNPGDQPVVGDWDGDGWYTPGVFRPSTGTWYLSNSIFAQSGADEVVRFGSPGDVAVPQTPDPEYGSTLLAVYRPSTLTWYMRDSLTDGAADRTLQFGRAGDVPVAVDYALALYRPSDATWHYRRWSDGALSSAAYGARGDRPVPGPWGSGASGLGGWRGAPAQGVYRASDNTLRFLASSVDGTQAVIRFGLSTDVFVGLPPKCRTGEWAHLKGSTPFCDPAPPTTPR